MNGEGWVVELQEASNVPDGISPQLLWTDPPFGTGKKQSRGGSEFSDPKQVDYVLSALSAWLPVMNEHGVVCVLVDYRSSSKVVESITGQGWSHRGDIIWTFGLGRPRTSWWANRHNVIATFTRSDNHGLFLSDAVPRERRKAPKARYENDKPVGSVWDYTMSNTDPERVGYPNQKPMAIIEPFVLCHSNPGDLVVDPFMGSGSTGIAAIRNNRNFYGGDMSPDAVRVTTDRLASECQGVDSDTTSDKQALR